MWTSPLTSPHKCPLLPLPHHPHPQILLGTSTEDQSSAQRAELLEELAEVMALQERALALDVGLPQLRVAQQLPGELSRPIIMPAFHAWLSLLQVAKRAGNTMLRWRLPSLPCSL